MKLNCDMGESTAYELVATDAEVMPYIDMANIACGFHAGSAPTMLATLALAKANHVEVGAHPSYPDRANFGRKSMVMPASQLRALILYQLGAMDTLCRSAAVELSYVKPHGALYNDKQANQELFETVVATVSEFNQQRKGTPLYLVTLAKPNRDWQQQIASQYDVQLCQEAFADRRYEADGSLRSRQYDDAVLHDPAEILEQARKIAQGEAIIAADKSSLVLPADTICVHGDNPEAIATVAKIRSMLGARVGGN